MKNRQRGFSLLEIVVAFTIIAIVTTMSVNVVAQNASRIHRLDQYVKIMNAADNAVAMLRMEMMDDRGRVKPVYQGNLDKTYHWQASVKDMHEAGQEKLRILRLYKVVMSVFRKDRKEPVYSLVTMVVDK